LGETDRDVVELFLPVTVSVTAGELLVANLLSPL
jgi:hypothetical protein